MFKIRGGIAVILATIIGIVLLIVALSAAQDAIQVRSVSKKDVFTVSGSARFTERSDEKVWRSKKYVHVSLQDYPATFSITKRTEEYNALAFEKALDTTARVTIPKDALGLLQTRSDIKLYELRSAKGKVLYSFADAVERDKADRLRLYLQAAFCFFAGLVLLIVPKRYLVKQ